MAQAAADALADFANRAKGGIPDDIPEVTLSLPGAPGWASARCSSRRGWCLDAAVVSDKGLKVAAGSFVVQVGKRRFARVTLT
jgi:tyrosyl-tRNA synthetase